jgi:hypothetical protein
VDNTSTINIFDVWKMSQLSHVGLLIVVSIGVKLKIVREKVIRTRKKRFLWLKSWFKKWITLKKLHYFLDDWSFLIFPKLA